LLPAPGGQLEKNLPGDSAKGQDGRAIGSVRPGIRPAAGARATRKPRLLFRLSGVFLLRFADRQFAASLFQLPPRLTRFEPHDRSPAFVVAQPNEIAN
jgi:hypothetical protein